MRSFGEELAYALAFFVPHLFLAIMTTLLLNVPIYLSLGFFSTIGFLLHRNFALKKEQLRYLIECISESIYIKIGNAVKEHAQALKDTDDKEKETARAFKELEKIEKEDQEKILGSIFGFEGDTGLYAFLGMMTTDMLNGNIFKYAKDEEKFQYYYDRRYIQDGEK